MLIINEQYDDVLVLTFNHPKPQNPFNAAMQMELMKHLNEANKNDQIKAIVLYGGKDRSFSAGGDFKEIIVLQDEKIVANYLNDIIDFYINILSINKPIIAAVDSYAIGIGFQVALCADYRIGTSSTRYLMPELKNGVACTLGGLMTEFILGRFIMQQICYECEVISVQQSLDWKLLNEITETKTIVERAIEKAKFFGNFPDKAFRGTKQVNNKRFIKQLNEVREDTINVHCDVVINKQHVKYMENILGKKK